MLIAIFGRIWDEFGDGTNLGTTLNNQISAD